ncbi:hypothetical protein [Haloarcula nitratireducens]|uniref:Ig-like domain-containing protein n=1 Tax=Haloarcula nitratireducens TaxID=2487749 RepID=A0AAW4P6X4_9EURY|nr:hypothetical protein [Halomicroarcula nitratireducens]MBX0293554.1 hypothetical protein [Halomicroarcula nitratireducens]
MRRRQALSAVALSAASLAGCNSLGTPERTPADVTPADVPTATESPTETVTPPVTPDPDDPILFSISNETETRRTVSLTLTRADDTYIDESLTLDAGDGEAFDSGIRSPGEYELAVTVEDGPELSYTLSIGSFDVRSGSNHFVTVNSDEIRVFAEE